MVRALLSHTFLAVSHLVVRYPCRLTTLFRNIDLEVREERRRFCLQYTDDHHCGTTDLEFGALARAQFQHGAPRPRVGRDDDLRLGGVGQYATCGLTRHLAAVHPAFHPCVTLHE